MAGSLGRRIEALEKLYGSGAGDKCPRCSGTQTVIINGKVDSVSKRGHRFPHAAAVAFVTEEGSQRVCPVCGTRRVPRFRIGGPIPSR